MAPNIALSVDDVRYDLYVAHTTFSKKKRVGTYVNALALSRS